MMGTAAELDRVRIMCVMAMPDIPKLVTWAHFPGKFLDAHFKVSRGCCAMGSVFIFLLICAIEFLFSSGRLYEISGRTGCT